ncbi:C1QL [Mytilus coruscus]|uniref:C1QL n=1 Tax=Mytilus coruscus TaxID=42192 RepID=A0A6J8DG25_MYTCO|nr:C1QL [Mytilus coruscus]
MLMSCVQSITSQETRQNSTVEVPLLDNQQMPLVVLFDTTQLNQVLKNYIIKTVEETTDQRIPIIKKTVIEDIGYGVFTVSRNGLYFVSSTVMANRGKYLHCHLWKNNQSDVGIFGTDFSTGTLNTVMALKKGDRIYAKHDDNKADEQMYGNHWSMFSAYLIKNSIKDIGYEPGRIHERPAFTASMRTDSTLHSNEIIKFDQVWLNMGNGYNPTTGVFTVPRNGLYFVSSTVMSTVRHNLHCLLWKNNQITLGLFRLNYSSGTLHSAMPLKKGKIIYIKHDRGAEETMLGRHYSMFSAYLINEQ